jgi:hypothetical protein
MDRTDSCVFAGVGAPPPTSSGSISRSAPDGRDDSESTGESTGFDRLLGMTARPFPENAVKKTSRMLHTGSGYPRGATWQDVLRGRPVTRDDRPQDRYRRRLVECRCRDGGRSAFQNRLSVLPVVGRVE